MNKDNLIPITEEQLHYFMEHYAPKGVVSSEPRKVDGVTIRDLTIEGLPDMGVVGISVGEVAPQYMLYKNIYLITLTGPDAPQNPNTQGIPASFFQNHVEDDREVTFTNKMNWEQFRAAAALGIMQTLLSVTLAKVEVDDDELVKLSVKSADNLIAELRKPQTAD